jgi:hypothetical protein
MGQNGVSVHPRWRHEQMPQKHTQHSTVQLTKISRKGLEKKIEIKHEHNFTENQHSNRSINEDLQQQLLRLYIEHKNGTYALSSGHQTLIFEPTKFSP